LVANLWEVKFAAKTKYKKINYNFFLKLITENNNNRITGHLNANKKAGQLGHFYFL